MFRDSPDPDCSLLLLERLLAAYPAESLRQFERSPKLLHYAILVFGHSRFLSETLVQSSDLLPSLLRPSSMDRSFSSEEVHQRLARFRARCSSLDLSSVLARFKRREYVRILLRDVLRVSSLAETAAEISTLADILIENALREAQSRLHKRFGLPQHSDSQGRLATTSFAVIALGKLGGNELNYSSDVDLIYIFGDGPDPQNAALSGREYFVRLAQELTTILSQITPDGPVFRLDMRLRPQGNEGELAVGLGQALRYYSESAADWEKQALTKARFVAGDSTLARDFIYGVQPYVYTTQANFSAIATAQESRQKMHVRRSNAPAARDNLDVKLDRGGIREVEFLVQCLQRVYGGAEPWLRSASTLSCLQKLCDKQHLSSADFGDLSSAYELFRHVEHRLQLRYGQQTHQLPDSPQEAQVLQRAMAPYLSPQESSHQLGMLIRERMMAVTEICSRVIARQRDAQQRQGNSFELSGPAVRPWDASQQGILRRLAQDSPEAAAVARRDDLSPYARKNLFLFLSAATSTSDRYGTLLREASGLSKLIQIFECSDYLTEGLIRHPEQIAAIAELESTRRAAASDYLFDHLDLLLSNPADPVFSYVADANLPYSEKLAMLRRHYSHCTLVSGSRDVLEGRSVYQSLAETTGAAEEAIRTAFRIAGAPAGLAILALGRIGSGEFDLLSDADLLFVADHAGDMGGLRKTAEQIIHILGAYTRDGSVFPVDTRLRPRGNQGELVVSTSHLRDYFESEADAWEALVYTKLRFLAGSRAVAAEATAATQALFERFGNAPGFANAVRQMRDKLESSEPHSFKTGRGGIYDIDFLLGYLMIRHGVAGKNGGFRDRMWRLVSAGVLEKSVAATLDHSAELLRTVDHLTRLVTGRVLKALPASEHALKVVESLTAKCFGSAFPPGLAERCKQTMLTIRKIYDHELKAS